MANAIIVANFIVLPIYSTYAYNEIYVALFFAKILSTIAIYLGVLCSYLCGILKDKQMKNFFTITLTIVLAIFTTTVFASNGTNPTFTVNTLQVDITTNGTMQIKTIITAAGTENYEIQRSYDNKNFQTIAMIMGDENTANTQAIKINDKVNKTATKAFYRLVKVNETNANIIATTKVTLH